MEEESELPTQEAVQHVGPAAMVHTQEGGKKMQPSALVTEQDELQEVERMIEETRKEVQKAKGIWQDTCGGKCSYQRKAE